MKVQAREIADVSNTKEHLVAIDQGITTFGHGYCSGSSLADGGIASHPHLIRIGNGTGEKLNRRIAILKKAKERAYPKDKPTNCKWDN